MELEQILQNHRFERRDLPAHHPYVALRLDGHLVKFTSREVSRGTGATESWLEEIVRVLELSYEKVALERFGILPAPEGVASATEDPGSAATTSAVSDEPMNSYSWIQDRLREKHAARRPAGSNGSREEARAPAE